MYSDFKIEAGAKYVFAQKTVFTHLAQGQCKIAHRKRIFLTYIDKPFMGANGIGADYEPLQHAVRIALKQAPIHKGTRVTFVCIDDDIFYISRGVASCFPLHSGGESPATPTPQVSPLYRLQHFLRAHLKKNLS